MSIAKPKSGQIHPNKYGSAGSLANTVGMIIPVTPPAMSGAVFNESTLSDISSLSASSLLSQYLPGSSGASNVMEAALGIMQESAKEATPSPAVIAHMAQVLAVETSMISVRQQKVNQTEAMGGISNTAQQESILANDINALEALKQQLDEQTAKIPHFEKVIPVLKAASTAAHIAQQIDNGKFGMAGLMSAMNAGSALSKLASKSLNTA